MQITAIQNGIPTTGQSLVKDIGREPKHFLVTGEAGLSTGLLIRVDGELMTVTSIDNAGDAGVELDQDITASADQISVNKPTFMREGYVVHIGDELVKVGKPVDTLQTLGETIGRAQSSFTISGTANIDEGTVIRIDGELMRITQIVSPTTIDIKREQNETTAGAHSAGAGIFRLTPGDTADAAPVEEDTGQTLLGGISADATSAIVSGSAKIAVDGTYRIDNEQITVTAIHPAVVRIERAVGGTKRAEHARRADIFVGNLFDAERGFGDTAASPHASGDSLLFTEVSVNREVAHSKLADHQKGDEIFLGNDLVVSRGVLNTDPAEHANGEKVYNFPTAPDSPATTGVVDGKAVEVCGQYAQVGGGEEIPTPVPGAPEVTVNLHEFQVDVDPTTAAAGNLGFIVTDTGASPHNFRVIQTDLPSDQLPLSSDGLTVDEAQVNVVGGFSTAIQPNTQQPVGADLPAGSYVLICNVPTHYESGMHTSFTVNP
jgi:hypothetical protein